MFVKLINRMGRLWRSIYRTEVVRLDLTLNYGDGDVHPLNSLCLYTKDRQVVRRKLARFIISNCTLEDLEHANDCFEILLKPGLFRSRRNLDIVHRELGYAIRSLYHTLRSNECASTVYPIIHEATPPRVVFTLRRRIERWPNTLASPM